MVWQDSDHYYIPALSVNLFNTCALIAMHAVNAAFKCIVRHLPLQHFGPFPPMLFRSSYNLINPFSATDWISCMTYADSVAEDQSAHPHSLT